MISRNCFKYIRIDWRKLSVIEKIKTEVPKSISCFITFTTGKFGYTYIFFLFTKKSQYFSQTKWSVVVVINKASSSFDNGSTDFHDTIY